MKAKYLICIVGPTASGKTDLAIKVARHFKTEIISADSRQVFQEMNIGTAKPSKEELALVRHRFINSHSINEGFSAGDFEKQGLELLKALFENMNVVVLVGGSGLYINALINGFDAFPDISEGIREDLKVQLSEKGIDTLLSELYEKDQAYFEMVDQSNPQRVIRALEVIRQTGKPFSSFLGASGSRRQFSTLKVGIEWPRDMLYDRINQRVDLMMEEGLEEEARALYDKRHNNALQTVGYSELFDHFDGKHSLKEAVELIKRNSRRYAKRQLTWFRKDNQIHWFKFDSLAKVLPWLEGKLMSD